ncbi:MAG: T9SS type A sorting domain-containing protein [Bacteroidia bacterium]
MLKKSFLILILTVITLFTACKKDVSTMPQVEKPNPSTVVVPPVVIQILIYPNPCTSQFTLQTNATVSQTVQIVNVLGQIVLTQTINGTTNFAVGTFQNGVYYVKITTGSSSIIKKIVIQH